VKPSRAREDSWNEIASKNVSKEGEIEQMSRSERKVERADFFCIGEVMTILLEQIGGLVGKGDTVVETDHETRVCTGKILITIPLRKKFNYRYRRGEREGKKDRSVSTKWTGGGLA